MIIDIGSKTSGKVKLFLQGYLTIKNWSQDLTQRMFVYFILLGWWRGSWRRVDLFKIYLEGRISRGASVWIWATRERGTAEELQGLWREHLGGVGWQKRQVGAVPWTKGQDWVVSSTTGWARISGRIKILRWIVASLWLRRMTCLGYLHLYLLCCVVHREERAFSFQLENLGLIIWVFGLECKIWLHVHLYIVCLKSAKLLCSLWKLVSLP